MAILTAHETLPRHHLQVSLAQELDLPEFRRLKITNAVGVKTWVIF